MYGDKILIVDDDKDLRSELCGALEGYQIEEASSGGAALRLLKRATDIDLVILDIRLPGLSGLQVLKNIKESYPVIVVIIMTGYGSKEVVLEALRERADDYIEKPFTLENLKSAVERLLSERRLAAGLENSGITGKIEQVKRYLEYNYFKKVNLCDASGIACLSPKYLSRVFKATTGREFGEYRLSVKIAKAKEFLIKDGYKVNAVAEKLGYGNSEPFIRQFKKITSLTPSEYRKKCLSDPESLKLK